MIKALVAIALLALFTMAQTDGYKYVGAGLAVGLAGVGAGIGVGIAGAAAISAYLEKPGEKVWYLIFIALAEAVAIYGLVISLMLLLVV